MAFIMDLDSETLVDLLNKAVEKETEDKIWEKWLAQMPKMESEILPFDQYKKRHFEKKDNQKKTDEEILQDAENILKSMSRK